jgi:glucokinase
MLAPDVIVIGGGLAEAMPELFKKEVSKTAEENVMPAFRGTFAVQIAKLGDDAGILGAAGWAERNAG